MVYNALMSPAYTIFISIFKDLVHNFNYLKPGPACTSVAHVSQKICSWKVV